jgi:uncharacterized membrane protein YjfL (UPF0719 family)
MAIIDSVLSTLIYLVLTFALMYVGKIAYQLFNPKINVRDELVFKDNLAFAVAHTGYFIGLIMSLGGALIGESAGIIKDSLYMIAYGLGGIILLNLSVIVNSQFILHKFSVQKEIIQDQNVGTGVVEGALAIATGLIIMASLTVKGATIYTALSYWIIGMALLILTSFVYSWILPYNLQEHIERDNVAVGIGFAGALIAIANLIRFALTNEFVSWLVTFKNIGIDVGIGLLFLPIARWAAGKVLLPGQKLTDELINQQKPNIGAGILEAFAYIGGSVIITWSM